MVQNLLKGVFYVQYESNYVEFTIVGSGEGFFFEYLDGSKRQSYIINKQL
ncbi:hypothetical protein AAGC94_07420 [Clostridium sporogenes]